jgi:hypothetical protein
MKISLILKVDTSQEGVGTLKSFTSFKIVLYFATMGAKIQLSKKSL